MKNVRLDFAYSGVACRAPEILETSEFASVLVRSLAHAEVKNLSGFKENSLALKAQLKTERGRISEPESDWRLSSTRLLIMVATARNW